MGDHDLTRFTRLIGVPEGAIVTVTATQAGQSVTLGPVAWRVAPLPEMGSTAGGVMIISGGADPGAVTATTTEGGITLA
jgi:hypothetical protein